jgi:periplasmic copper chaperone A
MRTLEKSLVMDAAGGPSEPLMEKPPMTRTLAILLTAAGALAAAPAAAHITLERTQAAPGTFYKAVLAVPHGCAGSATVRLAVHIPDGVVTVKPMPKPGWTVDVVRGPYGRSYKVMHGEVSEGAREISWRGHLDDAYYDEFVFTAYLAATLPEGPLYFPTVQECDTGSTRWEDIPAAGQDAHTLKAPAPMVRLVAGGAAMPASFKAGDIVVSAAWLRATPNGARVAGGYMTITNNGREADRLVGGTLAQAGRLEIHEMTMTDNVMRMRPLANGLVIKPGETIKLEPGGLHIMGLDLSAGYAQGQTIKGTLVFEKAGTMTVDYTVAPMGGEGGHSHH